MKKKNHIELKPWCPFCGMDVGRAREAVQRKLNEFPVGQCECGAVYVCDATGHNVGSAMVECLVHACNDDWDLAWELLPEEDYLTGRVENYDDVTHQVVETRNLDGRAVRGVLYFVRLHKEIADVVARVEQKRAGGESGAAPEPGAAAPGRTARPERKGPRKRADKRLVKQLAQQGDIDELVELAFDDKKTLRFLQRLLYAPVEDERQHTIWVLGRVCGVVAESEPGQVADLLHRLFEACADSASTSWGMVEAIGSVVASRPDIYGAFSRYLLNYLGDPQRMAGVLWALGEIGGVRPDLIRKMPFYSLFKYLEHDNAVVRGLTVRMLGRIKAREAAFQLMGLKADQSEIIIYEQGQPVRVTVSELVDRAVENIHKTDEGRSEK